MIKKIKRYSKPPKGYHKVTGATTVPKGYTYYRKGSRFDKNKKSSIVMVKNKNYKYIEQDKKRKNKLKNTKIVRVRSYIKHQPTKYKKR